MSHASPRAATDLPRRMPRTFQGLNRMHPLRPISDDTELEDALRVVDRLAGLEDRTPDQTDYVASLTTLLRAYESEHHPYEIARGDWPVHERIAHLIAMSDMTASDLGELLGNRSLGSKLMRGEREPSKTHIRTLAERFKVSPAFFL